MDAGGETGTDGPASSDGTDPSVATTTTTVPPPGTVGGETGQVPPDPTGADFPGPAGECWHSVPLFQAPDHASLVPYDQDADGAQELWLF